MIKSLQLPVTLRDCRIDILRLIALIGIVIAHIGPSDFVMQLRNFDVPLMVILSAISFSLSYRKENYIKYCWKRVKRLIVPTWIFLSIYFLIFEEDDIITIITSYLLIWGIGYVWIIRVFFLTSVAAPLLYKFNNIVQSNKKFLIVIFLLFVVSEGLILLSTNLVASNLIARTLFISYPYLIIFLFGLRVPSLTKSEMVKTILFYAVLFLAFGVILALISDRIILTSEYKYPPRLYYIVFSFMGSLILYAMSDKIVTLINKFPQYIEYPLYWLSQHTLWIYLWHIIFVEYVKIYGSSFVRFIVVFCGASVLTYLQCLCLKYIYPMVKSEVVKKNCKIIFEG